MQPDTLSALMEKFKQLYAMIKKLRSFKVQKMGQILRVKKVPFCKSGHILRRSPKCNNYVLCTALTHYSQQ